MPFPSTSSCEYLGQPVDTVSITATLGHKIDLEASNTMSEGKDDEGESTPTLRLRWNPDLTATVERRSRPLIKQVVGKMQLMIARALSREKLRMQRHDVLLPFSAH